MKSFRLFSLFLALGLAAFIGFVFWLTVIKNHDYFMSHWGAMGDRGAWFLAVMIIGIFFIGEARPIWISHLHDSANALHQQGSTPGEAKQGTKDLRKQAQEELQMNRRGFAWAKSFAVIITLIDFVWSCIIFPPFKAPLDKVLDDITYNGAGAINWGNAALIVGNVVLIPIAFYFLCKELEILKMGTGKAKATAQAPQTEPQAESRQDRKPEPSPYSSTTPQPYYSGTNSQQQGAEQNGKKPEPVSR